MASKRGLDVGCKRDITSSPAEGDREESRGDDPGVDDLVLWRLPEGEVPNSEQHDGIESNPRNRSGDEVGEKEDEKSAEQFT